MTMLKSDCEHALSRILIYIRLLGLPVSREISIEALRLVEEAMQQSPDDIFGYVMQRLPHRFSLPPPSIPRPMPPVNRGSIGYGGPR
jgi:hypothetical protein